MSKAKTLNDGEEIQVEYSPNGSYKNYSFRIICCDCELTHRVSLVPTKNGVKLRFWRDNRLTKARRKKRIEDR